MKGMAFCATEKNKFYIITTLFLLAYFVANKIFFFGIS
jgi:hypothetical protein